MYMPVWLLTSGRVGRRFLVQWDFFPDAQVQIGMLRGRLKIKLLRALESYLMRRFDVIGCMSPKNIEYLRNHCAIGPGTQSVHLPLWTSRPAFKRESQAVVRQRYGLPQTFMSSSLVVNLLPDGELTICWLQLSESMLQPTPSSFCLLGVGLLPRTSMLWSEPAIGASSCCPAFHAVNTCHCFGLRHRCRVYPA